MQVNWVVTQSGEARQGPDTRTKAWGLGWRQFQLSVLGHRAEPNPVSNPVRCWVPKGRAPGPPSSSMRPRWDIKCMEKLSTWEQRPGLVPGRGADGGALTRLQWLLSLLQKNHGPKIWSIFTQHETIRYTFCLLEQDGETVSHNSVPLQFPSPVWLCQLRSWTITVMFFFFQFHVLLFSNILKIISWSTKESHFYKGDLEVKGSSHSWFLDLSGLGSPSGESEHKHQANLLRKMGASEKPVCAKAIIKVLRGWVCSPVNLWWGPGLATPWLCDK